MVFYLNYLSFACSVKRFEIFIETNNLSNVDENAYAYPFWINKNIHINIYRNRINETKRIRIYTFYPTTRKLADLFNKCSTLTNIHQAELDSLLNVPSLFCLSHLTHQDVYRLKMILWFICKFLHTIEIISEYSSFTIEFNEWMSRDLSDISMSTNSLFTYKWSIFLWYLFESFPSIIRKK